MLISLLILLIVAGAVLYVVGVLPIDSTIKTIVKVGVIVVVVIYLLRLVAPELGGL